MSTAVVSPLRGDPPSSAGPVRPAADDPARERSGNGPSPLVVRLVACLALALFGAQAWGEMVRPDANASVSFAAVLGAALAVVVLLAVVPLRRGRRGLALAGVGFGAVLVALLTAGVDVGQLGPRAWDDLVGGLGGGIAALPGLSVPYRGVDEWNRIAMLLGGTLLAVAGPLLATWPGRDGRIAGPGVPAVILSVLYAVPAVQLRADHPVLDGTIFALLLALVLFAERLTPRTAMGAVPPLVAALVVGALFAPRLDNPEPWLDYESLAQSLGERGTTAFSWDHGYGPLNWPRDGREVLRVKADESAYWKATTLGDFDGLRWRDVQADIPDDPAAESPNPDWVHNLRVSVRNLRTNQFVTAGTTLRIDRSPRAVRQGAPGSFITEDEPLRRGHAYLARVYIPKPKGAELEEAGTDYPTTLGPYLTMQLPQRVGGPAATDRDNPAWVEFSAYGNGTPALGTYGVGGYSERVGEQWVRDSQYRRMYELAQRLKGQSTSAYDYVRRVQAHFQSGYTYSEQPPPADNPLDAFVFEDKIGYCQQFSGAMTLLLRMGGIPARVASGFTPGTLDTTNDEYVVRDLDAHSWVEAYFPGYGWMTFDPTPAIAPPRSQAAGVEQQAADEPEEEEEETGSARAERGTDAAPVDAGAAEETSEGAPVGLYVTGGVAAALLLAAGGFVVLRRRRRAAMTTEDYVAELERALRRSGRMPQQGMTLSGLEQRLGAGTGAAGYVRTLIEGRYGYGGSPPTGAQRTALRRELAAGLGLRGRLRALWALPPW